MAKKSLRPTEEEAAIDMTPMLDIVFIMLIFFIVTTAFVKEAGVAVERPNADEPTERKANIFIGVTEHGDVYMLRRKVEKESVRALLEKELIENPESQVVIQADKNSDSGIMLDILDAARRAKVKQVSVAAER